VAHWPAFATDMTSMLATRLKAVFDTDIRQSLASKVVNAWALAAYNISTTNLGRPQILGTESASAAGGLRPGTI
jgi:hypothetical protein